MMLVLPHMLDLHWHLSSATNISPEFHDYAGGSGTHSPTNHIHKVNNPTLCRGTVESSISTDVHLAEYYASSLLLSSSYVALDCGVLYQPALFLPFTVRHTSLTCLHRNAVCMSGNCFLHSRMELEAESLMPILVDFLMGGPMARWSQVFLF